MSRVVVIGLGPAGPDLMTHAAVTEIEVARPRFVRTRRHPAASLLVDAVSFDDLYEQADSFDEVYGSIVDHLVLAARQHGEVLYAVPGSPAVAEHTVALLRSDDRVETRVVPALSFCDLTWTTLAVDPVAAGVSLIDGRRFSSEASGRSGPLLVGQCDQRHVLSDIKLNVDEGPIVTVLQRLGGPDEAVFDVPWDELDRSFEPDHLTSLWIPDLPSDAGSALATFDEVARRLRIECPWDRIQTHDSLRPFVLEEAAEVVEAIDALGDDPTDEAIAALESELGDLLFQVVIHATLGAETGWFDLASVIRGIQDKLVGRHPHVFGDETATTPAEAAVLWRAAKAAERTRTAGPN